MALASGARLVPYEILSPLGSGGMGEVYRARDTKLGRDVALKILPEVFATDPDRLARFKRKAQVLASLNHPNIGAIHGFEESNGVQALVLELVDGPTLADRIAQGPIPLDETLPIARQIAEALEADVQSFPAPRGKWQVSTSGGDLPIWSLDGKELFFIGADRKLMAVEVKSCASTEPTGKDVVTFEAGVPKPLFETRPGAGTWYDVSKDGRFLMPTQLEQAAIVPMTVVVNWTAGLKR